MPIALTCECGARFEIDESFSGRDMPCPDCGVAVRTPSRAASTSPRPAWPALAAAALLLVGAFTVVGSAAASVLALFALWRIRSSPQAVGGQRLALAVAIAGPILTAATALAWTRPDWLPVAALLRRQALAGQLDAGGPMEIQGADGVCSLTRPSRDWARATRGRVGDPAVGDLQKDRQFVLAFLPEKAYADVSRLDGQGARPFSELIGPITDEMLPERELDEGQRPAAFRPTAIARSETRADEIDGRRGRQWTIDLTRGGLRWTFLVRAYVKARPAASDTVYVVRAYAPSSSFARLEPELQKVIDAVHFGR